MGLSPNMWKAKKFSAAIAHFELQILIWFYSPKNTGVSPMSTLLFYRLIAFDYGCLCVFSVCDVDGDTLFIYCVSPWKFTTKELASFNIQAIIHYEQLKNRKKKCFVVVVVVVAIFRIKTWNWCSVCLLCFFWACTHPNDFEWFILEECKMIRFLKICYYILVHHEMNDEMAEE